MQLGMGVADPGIDGGEAPGKTAVDQDPMPRPGASLCCLTPPQSRRPAEPSLVNVQVIADAAGRLVWASPALPGSVHDLTAARTHGIIDILTSADVITFADKGYQGAGGTVRTPFKRHRHRPRLSRRQKAVNKAHAKIRACGERAIAARKTWKVLAKLRCCPRRATMIVQAILVLHHVETGRHAR